MLGKLDDNGNCKEHGTMYCTAHECGTEYDYRVQTVSDVNQTVKIDVLICTRLNRNMIELFTSNFKGWISLFLCKDLFLIRVSASYVVKTLGRIVI